MFDFIRIESLESKRRKLLESVGLPTVQLLFLLIKVLQPIIWDQLLCSDLYS